MNPAIVSNRSYSYRATGWSITLWTLQAALAAGFAIAGAMKLAMPIGQLHATHPYAVGLPDPLMRFIGLSELAGAFGLLLPSLARIRPQLTVAAASGLALMMFLAIFLHVVRGEFSEVATNILLGAVACVIAWGRSRRAPITPRPYVSAADDTHHLCPCNQGGGS